MLQVILVGYLGSDAEVKNANGKEFITFRVAHSDRWTGADGLKHEQTQWVDCTMNGTPSVKEYLKRGTLVFISGNASTRVYSSPKDKCMKAGLQVNVTKLELLGGKTDDIPSVLAREDDGAVMHVSKYYGVKELAGNPTNPAITFFNDDKGHRYIADQYGWVSRADEQQVQP